MDKLRVLVVDDSLVYRKIISSAVEKTGIAYVDCTASSGVTALERLEQRPIDVVLLDIYMPEMDGIETLIQIKRRYSKLPVIIISSGGEDGAKTTVKALEQGAMDFVLKPLEGDPEKNISAISRHLGTLFSQIVMDKYAVKQLEDGSTAETIIEDQAAHQPQYLPEERPVPDPFRKVYIRDVDLVVIASSTGGPKAVEEVCGSLGRDFMKPILIVQHMPPDFTRIFAEYLSKKCQIAVKEAQEGDKIKGGQVLVAPGGFHMTVVSEGQLGSRISLNSLPPVHGVRPAADILFQSVAKSYRGKKVLAVILTGMGSDGTIGLKALKESCQCYCITQSKETCVIYGMPRSVDEAGLSDESMDLSDIGRRITEMSRGRW